MASYLDEQYQFAPYVETTPVDEMVKVGMAKQQMFDEGFQKVQSWFDQLASLPTAREVDAQYVQGAINNLNAEIGKVVGADWSNQQLLNAVGGLATKISRDKNIVTAVQSANRIAEGTKKVDEDRSKGTLRPENEDAFYESVMNFRKTTDLGRSFNDDYSPGFDVEKYVKEMFNESLKPDGLTYDMVFKTDINGNAVLNEKGEREYSPTMNRFEWESPTFQRVRATLDKIFAEPRVAKQLEITGRYVYKPYGGQQLKNIVNEKGSTLLRDFDNSLTQLYYRKEQAKTEQEKLQIQQTIDDVLHNKEIVTGYYNDLIGAVDKNPEGVRANIYKNEIKNGFTSMYNWKKTKYLQMDNPGAQYAFKLQELAFNANKFAKQLELDWYNAKSNDAYKRGMLGVAQWKATHPTKGGVWIDTDGDGEPDTLVGGGDGTGEPTADGGPIPTDKPSGTNPYQYFVSQYENTGNQFKGATNSLIWNGFLSKDPAYTAKLNQYVNAGLGQDAAIEKMIGEAAAAAGMSVSEYKAQTAQNVVTDYNNLSQEEKANNPITGTLVESFRLKSRDWKTVNDIMASIEKRAGAETFNKTAVTKELGIQPQTFDVRGQKITADPEDMYNLAVYIVGNKSAIVNNTQFNDEAKRAEKALKAKGLQPLLDELIYQQDFFFQKHGTLGEATAPITQLARGLRDAPQTIYRAIAEGGIKELDWGQVGKIYKKLNTDSRVEAIKNKEKATNDIFHVPNDVTAILFTGKATDDKGILQKTRVFSSDYAAGTVANQSPTFEGFKNNISPEKWRDNFVVSFQVEVKPDGTPQPKVRLSTGNSILGEMYITADEAKKGYGQDINRYYEPADITMLRNAIEQNPALQNSAGNPFELGTYKSGDFYHDKRDFPNLVNSNLNVGVNYKKVDGMFYPFVYMSDGTKEKVVRLNGKENLNVLVQGLKNVLTVQRVLDELKR